MLFSLNYSTKSDNFTLNMTIFVWIVLVLLAVGCNASPVARRRKVVKANCIFHGVRHGELWQDPLLPCVQKKCINGRMIDKITGCIHNGKCYEVNERWKEGCSQRSCVYFEDYYMGRKYHFYVVDGTAWCRTSDGQCIAPGTEWDHDCYKYKCIEEDYVNVKEARIEKIGKISNCTCCKYNGACYSAGTTWSDNNCTDHYCDLVNYRGQMTEVITSVPGCNYEGKCFKFAETVVNNCSILKCSTEDGIHIGWNIIKKACPVGNRCVNVNEPWRNESTCMEYYCVDVNNTAIKTIKKQYGCIYNDKCIPFDEHYYDETCYYRLCSLQENMVVTRVQKAGCPGMNGKCYSYGESGFTQVINGHIMVNCTCEQSGKTGSLTLCIRKGSRDEPAVVAYHVDSFSSISKIRIKNEKKIVYNDDSYDSIRNTGIGSYLGKKNNAGLLNSN